MLGFTGVCGPSRGIGNDSSLSDYIKRITISRKNVNCDICPFMLRWILQATTTALFRVLGKNGHHHFLPFILGRRTIHSPTISGFPFIRKGKYQTKNHRWKKSSANPAVRCCGDDTFSLPSATVTSVSGPDSQHTSSDRLLRLPVDAAAIWQVPFDLCGHA
ncbi:hypothetical protein AVEN_182150-1 [Araneus ventricosus]|uniref:Uncharacterized protein n=1 Tax=Araneus ventricosus TaxID=182803 RepID=A0A4Y2GQW1_ARAVE|nr:hypothetical protein AVEN_182150-1 [Araneus ventricosus]